MNNFEFTFISVMFGVIMGMGVVYILIAIAEIIRGFGSEIKPYWLHTAWVFFLLLLHFHVWWGLWDFQNITEWNYFTYLFLLTGPILLFISAALIIPEDRNTSQINLKEYYYKNNSNFFVTLSLTVIWGMLLYPIFFDKMDPVFEWLFIFLLTTISLIFINKPKFQIILSTLAWILFLSWVISYGFLIVAE